MRRRFFCYFFVSFLWWRLKGGWISNGYNGDENDDVNVVMAKSEGFWEIEWRKVPSPSALMAATWGWGIYKVLMPFSHFNNLHFWCSCAHFSIHWGMRSPRRKVLVVGDNIYFKYIFVYICIIYTYNIYLQKKNNNKQQTIQFNLITLKHTFLVHVKLVLPLLNGVLVLLFKW